MALPVFELPGTLLSFQLVLGSFVAYEMCIGMYWPLISSLRSKHFPDSVRATTMTMFRMPLNFLVVLTLAYVGKLPESVVFSGCSVELLLAFCGCIYLWAVARSRQQRGGGLTASRSAGKFANLPGRWSESAMERRSPSLEWAPRSLHGWLRTMMAMAAAAVNCVSCTSTKAHTNATFTRT